MKNDFVAEILRATTSLRSGDPAGATDIIRASLAAGGLGTQETAQPSSAQSTAEGASAAAGRFQPAQRQGRKGGLRKSLGETVRSLSRGRSGAQHGQGASGRPAVIPVPDGAEFRDLQFSCAAGQRRYRLYIPAPSAGAIQGMVVMLHGCTQDPEDFAAGTGMNALGEKHRLIVVYPAQTNRENTMSCWNWFRPSDQNRGAGEPAIIAGLTESIREEFAIPANRVFIAGLSAGGAMAAIMGETYPDLYAGVGVHSGLPYGSAHDVPSAFSAMKNGGHGADPADRGRRGGVDGDAPRVIVFHGSADRTVHPENARQLMESRGADTKQIMRTDHAAAEGHHAYSRLVVRTGDGGSRMECWMIKGADHAWSGGNPGGSYTDPRGPDASAEMIRFFLAGKGIEQ